MNNRSSDWIKQAKLDLDHAIESSKLKHYEWSCLAAQQAAEKAVKSIFYTLKAEVWGHGIARLLQELPKKINPPGYLIQNAKQLDRHYIPARYPNGLISGTPRENYTKKDAKEAIDYAQEIIEFCEDSLSNEKI